MRRSKGGMSLEQTLGAPQIALTTCAKKTLKKLPQYFRCDFNKSISASQQCNHLQLAMAQSDEEDDYMTMVFDDAPKQPKYETSMQRAARERREAEARARPKSKAELQAEADAMREASLATALPETNKGFKMMAKFGFKRGDALGKSEHARREPIQLNIKEDRGGVGLESDKKRKIREQWEKAEREAKRSRQEEGNFLEMRRQEQKEKKAEKDLDNAQRTAERLFEKEAEKEADKGTPSKHEETLKDVNVLWRTRVRRRAEFMREKRKKREIDEGVVSRLPDIADEEEDIDTKIALGKDAEPFFTSLEEESLEEDPELAEFEALPVADRLHKVLVYLRENHHYCYWCGHQFPDTAMEGCPGVTEEEHD